MHNAGGWDAGTITEAFELADKVLYLHDYDCNITAESLPRNPTTEVA